MVPLLIGIVLAACVFAALLWSIYRTVQTKGNLRLNYALLSISTLTIAAGITYDLLGLMVSAGVTCMGTAIIAIVKDPGWSKLLPVTQLLLGGASAYFANAILFA
ncbi:MAG: hypothetical protein OXC60_10525 [Litoreibacter sp.]|nr:hypothetical protein [Litoreibacter sp.]MCY4335094.1 hypothetical protein [Litoreibacter sp.]